MCITVLVSRISRLSAAVLALLSCVALAAPAAASDKDGAPPGFVVLHDVDPTIRYDIRYFGQHNFVGDRIDGYRQQRRQVATAHVRRIDPCPAKWSRHVAVGTTSRSRPAELVNDRRDTPAVRTGPR